MMERGVLILSKIQTIMSTNHSWIKSFCLVSIVVLFIWVATYGLIFFLIDNWEVRGQFGDLFGSVNALFSGLAFAGMIITLRQQHSDLNYQRQSIEQSNEEMRHQTEEFNMQNKMLQRQQFDNTFFELLRMLQTIVLNLTLNVTYAIRFLGEDISLTRTGKEVFQELFTERQGKQILPYSDSMNSLYEAIRREGVDHTFLRKELAFLSHYFRFVYRIMKFVDESKVLASYEERYKYITYLRATLTDYEMVLLFYNCLASNGKQKFKPLVEKYALFNNIDEALLVDPQDIKLYDLSAFVKHSVVLEAGYGTLHIKQLGYDDFLWQLKVNVVSEFGASRIMRIYLQNDKYFNPQHGDLVNILEFYSGYINHYYDITDLNRKKALLEIQGLKATDSYDVKNLLIEENKPFEMLFSDINKLEFSSACVEKGWSLEIDYNSCCHLSIPLEVHVIGVIK